MAEKKKVRQNAIPANSTIPVVPVADSAPVTDNTPETPETPVVMDKAGALELINGLETAKARWIAFDKWVTSQADRASGITKASITTGLILESMTIEVKAYDKASVNALIAETMTITDDDKRAIERKLASVRALVSMAYNNAGKSKSKSDKTATDDKAKTDTGFAPNFGELEANLEAYLLTLNDNQFSSLKAIVSKVDGMRQERASKEQAEKSVSKAA